MRSMGNAKYFIVPRHTTQQIFLFKDASEILQMMIHFRNILVSLFETSPSY